MFLFSKPSAVNLSKRPLHDEGKGYPFPSFDNSAADDFERSLSKNRKSP